MTHIGCQPFLTVVLNNGGWKSPKFSMLGVHPEGHGSKVAGHQLSVGFGPDMPDYVGVAVAATGGWGNASKRVIPWRRQWQRPCGSWPRSGGVPL
jgi:hypothetical protein